jgi:hypothetical protein
VRISDVVLKILAAQSMAGLDLRSEIMIRLLTSVIRFASTGQQIRSPKPHFQLFQSPTPRHHKSKTVVPKSLNRPQLVDRLGFLF